MFLSYFVLIYDKDRRFFLYTKLIGYLFSVFEYFYLLFHCDYGDYSDYTLLYIQAAEF